MIPGRNAEAGAKARAKRAYRSPEKGAGRLAFDATLTQTEIARLWGTSHQAVAKAETAALGKIRDRLARDPVVMKWLEERGIGRDR
jgi:hypothetical protein